MKLSVPKISKGSQLIYDSKARPPTFEQLYKAAKELKDKRLLDCAKREKEVESKEMKEATFKPVLVHTSKKMNSVLKQSHSHPDMAFSFKNQNNRQVA